MNIANMWGFHEHPLNTSMEFVAGIECEIESVANANDGFEGFEATEDGSLRNNGVEFISKPFPKAALLEHFGNLHDNLVFKNKEQAFSPRTSTHVHINCRSLEASQVRTLVLLYALYEEFFFAMCEHGRRDNIHCVPLTETYLTGHYNHDLKKLIAIWHKYTALNIIPLSKLGTVEFRHLQGTDNPVLLEEWLTALENLWLLAQREPLSGENLANEDVLRSWWYRLFGHVPRIMALSPSFNNIIANSLLDVKLAFA